MLDEMIDGVGLKLIFVRTDVFRPVSFDGIGVFPQRLSTEMNERLHVIWDASVDPESYGIVFGPLSR